MRIVPVPSDGEHILLPFLELCCSWSMDRPPVDAEAIRADDHLNRYIEGWGRVGDLGVMALAVVLSFVLTLMLGFEDIPQEEAAADARQRQAGTQASHA